VRGFLISAPISGNPLTQSDPSAQIRSPNPATPSKPALPPLAHLLL
jgi:hypothetical protein